MRMVRSYTKETMDTKAKNIVAETKKNGKNPDRTHIINHLNGNLDVLSKTQLRVCRKIKIFGLIIRKYQITLHTILQLIILIK